MATTVTSARPIISAAAVEAVRPGLRTALSRASRPRAAEARGREPDDAASGFTSRGASMAMPMNSVEHAEDERERERHAAEQAGGDQASDRPARPARRAGRRSGPAGVAEEPSRTAEIGGTRVARRAGTMLATSVTIVPVSMRR